MKAQFTQSPVSKTVWPWPEAAQNSTAPPSLSRALTILIIGLTVSGIFFFNGHTVMATIVCAISVTIFLCSRFLPAQYAYIEKFGVRLSQGAGTALTWLLLVPVYYTFFMFGRLLQKLGGKDPMARSLTEDIESYWVSKESDTDPARYKRQF